MVGDILGFVEQVGIPITAALAVGYFLFIILKSELSFSASWSEIKPDDCSQSGDCDQRDVSSCD